MTHSPPIPPDNLPPYPAIEPPHATAAPDVVRTASEARAGREPTSIVGAVAAVGVAAVGVAAAVAIMRSRRAAPGATKRAVTARSAKAAPFGGKPKPRKAAAATSPATASRPKRAPRAGSDDKSVRGPQDAARIAMGEDYEVRYWTKKFGVDRDALQRAVDAVGNGAAAVERELGTS